MIKPDTLLKLCSSVRITVICLFWLFVLTFWGTVAQVQQGLYVAQERFFYSFFFLAAKWIPVPGGQLILWILFINLVAAAITHFSKLRHWRYIGLKLSHIGLLIYFVSAFVTFHVTEESYVHMAEGEGTNLSSSYEKWEIAYWTDKGDTRKVTAYTLSGIKIGETIPFNSPDFTISVDQFLLNAAAFTKTLPASGVRPLNGSGISLLQPKEVQKEREKNVAGGLFTFKTAKKTESVVLYGAESVPTRLMINGKEYFFSLRRVKKELPFTIRLDDFKVKFHPGTQTAASYESFATLTLPKGGERKTHIYMNNPLTFNAYTLFQASYDVDSQGREYSTLAVVKNTGRILPYIACFVVFFGLALHFLISAFYKRLSKT